MDITQKHFSRRPHIDANRAGPELKLNDGALPTVNCGAVGMATSTVKSGDSEASKC